MISGKDGVSKIIERLNKIYKKDELSQKYNALEAFETYKRKGNTSICDFLTEFEKRLHKTRTYGTTMSDDLLAYCLLKAANLTTQDEQLVKATITELNYEIVKSKKVFSDESQLTPPDVKSEVQIKSEPTFHTLNRFDETPYTQTYPDHYNKEEDQCDEENYKTFYTRGRDQNRCFRSHYPPNNQTGFNRYSASQSSSSNTNWRSPNIENRQTAPRQPTNPLDCNKLPTRCATCDSFNHWQQQCPDKDKVKHKTYIADEVVLHQNDYNSPHELKFLMAESWSSALLDCGATKTVCEKIWLDQFIQILDKIDQDQIKFNNSSHIYQFGDGRKIKAIKSAQIPAIIGSKKFQIETDVIEGDIPLLLSKSSMKRGNMKINFQDDTITILHEIIPLMTTSSGHYIIPITKAKQIINNFERGSTNSITLALSKVMDNYNVALKLHRQFAHPTQEKLLKLINNAGHPWSANNELKEKIKEVSNTCKTCKIYKKTPLRPVVGLPMVTRFQER